MLLLATVAPGLHILTFPAKLIGPFRRFRTLAEANWSAARAAAGE
ncbi:MAG: hypothetical protein AB1716_22600 [Planctomycetota bacterium]